MEGYAIHTVQTGIAVTEGVRMICTVLRGVSGIRKHHVYAPPIARSHAQVSGGKITVQCALYQSMYSFICTKELCITEQILPIFCLILLKLIAAYEVRTGRKELLSTIAAAGIHNKL